MKGWLRLGILFLIITSCIVVVNASAKSSNSCGTIYPGQTVDVSGCVSSTDIIGLWFSTSDKHKSPPSIMMTISNPQSFEVPNNLGTWYIVDQSTYTAGHIAFKIAVPK